MEVLDARKMGREAHRDLMDRVMKGADSKDNYPLLVGMQERMARWGQRGTAQRSGVGWGWVLGKSQRGDAGRKEMVGAWVGCLSLAAFRQSESCVPCSTSATQRVFGRSEARALSAA